MIGTVEKTLKFAASPERVWRAITDPDELSRWFPDRVDGGELQPGVEGGWLWEDHGRYAFQVEVMDPPKRLVWRWARDADTALEDGVTTTVEWLLEPTPDGGTVLRLRESGFALEKDRDVNDGGWDAELSELVALLDG
jgi:uncharacterized protein YndB with AHSA1/START domain